MSNRIYYSQEAEERVKRQIAVAVLLFAVIGGGIGALIALLLAPGSGEETREELSRAFNDGANAGRGATHEAVQRLEKEFSDFRQRIEDKVR